MRIFLLPISTRRILLYCDKTSHPPPSTNNTTFLSRLPDRIVTKANTTWADWERAPSGWKATLTRYGNTAFRRIAFEEWGLKSLPALHESTRAAARTATIIHPGALVLGPRHLLPAHDSAQNTDKSTPDLSAILRQLSTTRGPLHRSRLISSLIALPLTLPFGLVPILPNIPFFYAAFRAWSHYKALYGGRYLGFLLDQGLWRGELDVRLAEVYAQARWERLENSAAEKVGSELGSALGEKGGADEGDAETLLLGKSAAKDVAGLYELPELEVEIERAVEQVESALAKETVQTTTGQ